MKQANRVNNIIDILEGRWRTEDRSVSMFFAFIEDGDEWGIMFLESTSSHIIEMEFKIEVQNGIESLIYRKKNQKELESKFIIDRLSMTRMNIYKDHKTMVFFKEI